MPLLPSQRNLWTRTAPHLSQHLDLLELINIPAPTGTINLDFEETHYNEIAQMSHINMLQQTGLIRTTSDDVICDLLTCCWAACFLLWGLWEEQLWLLLVWIWIKGIHNKGLKWQVHFFLCHSFDFVPVFHFLSFFISCAQTSEY